MTRTRGIDTVDKGASREEFWPRRGPRAHETDRSRWRSEVDKKTSAWWAVAVALVAAFVASRVALVATSYDAVTNWEEPGFLYSALEVGRRGITSIFDYQDDLSHGASLPLIAIASRWVRVFGPGLDMLKGVAILWATVTLIVSILVGRRYVSPAAGILIGLLYAGLSENAARLQVTLVGSHPESVLFCTLALAMYWRGLEDDLPDTVEDPARERLITAALGFFSGLAVWCSYLAAPFVLSLVAFSIAAHSRRASLLAGGFAAGMLPWIIQNLWLRPQGALQWRERLAYFHAIRGHTWDGLEILERIGRSFGFNEPLGGFVLIVMVGLVVTAVTLSLSSGASVATARNPRPRRRRGIALTSRGTLPVALAALACAISIAVAQPNAVPDEGYFYYRFFMPLQCALFWLAVLAVAHLPAETRRRAYGAAYATLLGLWVLGQAGLYGRGHVYEANLARDRASGCAVFGHAELDRSGKPERALARLEQIDDEACRLAAFTGYGWALVSRYSRDGRAQELSDAILAVEQSQLRSQTCAAAEQLMATMYPQAMPEDRRRTGAQFLDAACS
jgi:hypothetical protein